MKLFEEREIFEAYKFAGTGGQALHLFTFNLNVYPGAPACFKRLQPDGVPNQTGHLLDQDLKRLKETAQILGIRVIKIDREGMPSQHVDLCGRPLKRAIEICEVKDE